MLNRMNMNPVFVNGDSIPEKRSGHIAVFHKGLLIVFGGYGDNRDDFNDDFMTSKSIWCYSVEASQWTRHNTKGEHPEKSTGSCACIVGDCLYHFGGYVQSKGQTNRLSVLNLSTLIWKDLSTEVSGLNPSPRDKFGCWVIGHEIIYFGGFGQPPTNLNSVKGEFCFEELPHSWGTGFGWNNSVFVLDTDEMKWSQPGCSGDIPCPRAAFSTSQKGELCYLFGGRFKDQRRNDMFVLNANTFRWTELRHPTGNLPCGRSWHVMEFVSDNHIFLYGGFDNEGNALKDTWIYEMDQNSWTEIKDGSNNLGVYAPRMWHTSCKTDQTGEVLIFGGCINSVITVDQSTKHSNTVAVFRFSPLTLKRQCLDYLMKHISRYSTSVIDLPLSLQRNIRHRSLALGLKSPNGHGKLVQNCQMM